jgi:sulfopyruvate decarboxylase TPP-binding subunit
VAAPDDGLEPGRPTSGEPPWAAGLWDALRAHDIAQVTYVPDAGLSGVIRRAVRSNDVVAVPLCSEQEGVALLAGAWLGGRRGVLCMQSSGVGNCINLLTLARTCRFPLLMVVTMRGQWGERNPWQVPMGSTAADALRLAGALVFEVDDATDVGPAVDAAAAMVFSGPAMAAVLIGQRVIGAKAFAATAGATP